MPTAKDVLSTGGSSWSGKVAARRKNSCSPDEDFDHSLLGLNSTQMMQP
jgi:hypothetical protein